MSDNNSPYQAPTKELTPEGEQQIADSIAVFHFSSRIGRLRYLAYSFGLMLLINLVVGMLMGVIAGASGSAELMLGSVIINSLVAIVISFVMAVRRFHDLDISGWAALLMIIPLINILVGLYLLFAPGTQGENRYGLQPPKNGTGVIITALIIPLVFVIGILAAIAIPAYQDYSERARAYEEGRSLEHSESYNSGSEYDSGSYE